MRDRRMLQSGKEGYQMLLPPISLDQVLHQGAARELKGCNFHRAPRLLDEVFPVFSSPGSILMSLPDACPG